MARRNNSKTDKKVEIDIERSDINKADLPQKYRGHGKNKNKKPQYPRSRRVSVASSKSADNDGTWYARNEQLMKDAASFSTGYPLGIPISDDFFPSFVSMENTNGKTHVGVPGVSVIEFVPTVGVSDNAQSAINMAARGIYSFVRYANSGSAVGAPSDMMMYLVSGDSLYAWHQSLVRVYGSMRRTDYANQYIPQTLVEAMGFDYNDLQQNLAQLRYHINSLAIRINRIAIPNDMTYFVRHAWLNSGVYLDGETDKSQMYVFRQIGFYKYVETTTPNQLQLVTPCQANTSIGDKAALLKYSNIVAFSEELLNAVLQSESFGITTGDIMKAYGRENLLSLAQIADDYVVMPAYSKEVLSQIENLDVFDFSSQIYCDTTPSGNFARGIFTISQDTETEGDNWITALDGEISYTKPTSGTAPQGMKNKVAKMYNISRTTAGKMLNWHFQTLNPTDAMVASRLMYRMDGVYVADANWAASNGMFPDGLGFIFSSVGSELVTGIRVYYVQKNKNTSNVITVSVNNKEVVLTQLASSASNGYGFATIGTTDQLSMLQQFDWHPETAMYIATGTPALNSNGTVGSVQQYWGDTRDIDNYALLSKSSIARMHEVALLSLFDSPKIQLMSRKGV